METFEKSESIQEYNYNLTKNKHNFFANQNINVLSIDKATDPSDLEFTSNISDIEYDVDVMNIVNVRGMNWVFNVEKPKIETFQNFSRQWSNFTTEIVCRHVKRFQPLLALFPDMKIINIRGEEVTPDFIRMENGTLTIYEFKSHIYKPPSDLINDIIREVSYKYQMYEKTELVIIFILADDFLPSVLPCGVIESRLFLIIRNEYYDFVTNHPEFLKNLRRESIEIYTPISKIMKKFKFNPWTKVEDYIENPRSYDDCLNFILKNIKPVKRYLERNILDTKDMIRILCNTKLVQNIFDESPLDRDSNRNYRKGNYGHCSTLLCPYMVGFKNMNFEEFTSYASGKESIEMMLITLSDISSNEQRIIRDINKYTAVLNTEHNKKVFEEINKKFNINSTDRKDARLLLFALASNVAKDATRKFDSLNTNQDRNWTFTRTGTFKLRDNDLKEHLHIDKFTPKYNVEKPIKDEPDFGFFDKNLDLSVMDSIMSPPETSFDFKTAYPFNESAQTLVDELAAWPLYMLKQIWKFGMFKHLFYTMMLFRDLLLNVSIHTVKFGRPDEFSVIRSKHTGSLVIGSLHPNEMTTGVIKIFQEVDTKTGKYLTHYKGNPFGRWRKVKKLSTNSMWIESDYFRLNYAFLSQFDVMLGSYMGNQSLWFSLHHSLLDNSLWNSLYLNYSRPLTNILDFIYATMMRSFTDISFGLTDAKGKFNNLMFKDLRCGTLFNNSLNDFSDFVDQIRHYSSTLVWKPITDPFFGVLMESFFDFLFITYTKHVYLQDDGIDKVKTLFGFYIKDIEFQESWDKNPFNSVYNESLKYTLEDFMSNLFVPGNSSKMVDVTFCSEYILSATSYHYDLIKANVRGTFTSYLNELIPTEGLKSSKVNVPDSWDVAKDRKSIYKGLVSVTVSEATFENIRLYFQDADEYENSLGNGFKVKKLQEPSILELVLYNMTKFPQVNIFVSHLKDQRGYGKRQFYQMTYDSKLGIESKDNAFRPLLKHSPYDMILISGDTKLEIIESEISKVYKDISQDSSMGLKSSGDMSKFSESMAQEAEECVSMALLTSGYITEEERNFISHIQKANHGRFHVMPAKSQEFVEKESKKTETSVIVKDLKSHKILEIITSTISRTMKGKDPDVDDYGIYADAFSQMGVFRNSGFGMGTDNILSTMLAILNVMLLQKSIERIHPQLIVKGRAHSDDLLTMTNLPRITAEMFKHWKPSRLIMFLERTNLKERVIDYRLKIIFANKSTRKRDDNQGIEWLSLYDVTCFFVTLSMFGPKLVGMQPSMFKWFFSPIGEVLQVVFTRDGSFVPLIRFTSAIQATLPGVSFGTDLVNACSRVLPLLQFGGTGELSTSLILSINILNRWRFGLKSGTVRFDELPVFFGGWYALPIHILESGFDAQTLRLLASSQTNNVLLSQLQLMMMTNEAWDLNVDIDEIRKLEELEKSKSDVLNVENTQYASVSLKDKDEFERFGDTFMDFLILFSRYISTLKSFSVQFKNHKKYIDQAKSDEIYTTAKNLIISFKRLPKVKKIDPEIEVVSDKLMSEAEELKDIKYRNLPLYLYGIQSFSMKVIDHLLKYLSRGFQASYLRVPKATQVINRIGLPERLMTNCLVGSRRFGTLVTVTEMIIIVKETSLIDRLIPQTNKQMLQFLKDVHIEDIQHIINSNYGFTNQYLDPDLQINVLSKMNFRKVRRLHLDIATGFKIKDMIGLIIETMCWKLAESETLLSKFKPTLFWNSNFMTTYQKTKDVIVSLRIKPKAIERNVVVLERALETTNRPIVAKTDSDNLSHSMLRFRLIIGQEYFFVSYESGVTYEAKKTGRNVSDKFSNLMARTFVIKNIFSSLIISKDIGKVTSEGFDLNLVEGDFYNDMFENRKFFTALDANTMMAYLDIKDRIGQIFLKYNSNSEEVYQFYLDCVKSVVSNFSAPLVYSIQGDVSQLDFFEYVILLIFEGNCLACFSVRSERKLIVFRYGADLQIKMLYRMMFNFLDKGTRHESYGNKNLEDVVMTVANNEGMFSFTYEEIWGIGNGNKAMFQVNRGLFEFEARQLKNTELIRYYKTEQNTWIQIGELKIRNYYEKNETIPKLYTPWIVNSNFSDCTLYESQTNKRILSSRYKEGPRMYLIADTVDRIIDKIFSINDLNGFLFTIIEKFKDGSNNLYPKDIFIHLQRLVPRDPVKVSYVSKSIETLMGSENILEPVTEYLDNVVDTVEIVEFLVEFDDINLELKSLKAMVIHTLILFVSINSGYSIYLHVDIMSLKVNTINSKRKVIKVDKLDYLLSLQDIDTQLVSLLNKRIFDFENESEADWIGKLIAYTCLLEDEDSFNILWDIFKNWHSLDSTEKPEQIERSNNISTLKPLNCSNHLLNIIIQEFMGSEQSFEFVSNVQKFMISPLFRNSRVKFEFIESWEPYKRFKPLLRFW